MKLTFETMTFFHRPVGLVELLILYARVQFYTPRASDYLLISKTATFNSVSVISWRSDFIDEGNQSTWRKPLTCSKSLTNLIT